MANLDWPVQVCQFPNGMRCVYERIPSASSANLAVWVHAGSQYEPPEQAGLAHLLEHLFFKGTPRRTAVEIVRAIEVGGGHIDAFTDKEYACYSVRVLPQFLPHAIDVLTDMLQHALFHPDDIEREKGVVLEEIHRTEEAPAELVEALYEQACWRDHPLGRPILGLAETVRQIDREALLAFRRRLYRPDRMLVAAAGNLPAGDWWEQLADCWEAADAAEAVPEPAVASFYPGRAALRRRTGQVHLVVGFPACGPADPDTYALSLLETYLGGGMSSRLFQEIREQRGWAYAVSASLIQYHQTGTMSVALGTSPENAPPSLELVQREVGRLLQEGMPADRLAQTQQQVEGQLVLGLEAPEAHVDWLAWSTLTYGRVLTPQEVIERYRAVSVADILRVARRYLVGLPALAGVGPLGIGRIREWQGLLL